MIDNLKATPLSDAALEHLAQYLYDKLNAMETGVIASYRAFDDIPTDASAYPALIIARTESEGEALQSCKATIKYMMMSQTERQARPGLFRWLELAIARAIREHAWIEDAPIQIKNASRLKTRYRIAMIGNALFPMLEVAIEFGDYVSL